MKKIVIPKKKYSKPSLKKFGSVAKLTLKGGSQLLDFDGQRYNA